MKQKIQTHRIAIAALSAAIVLPIAPVFAQDAPAAAPPPVVVISPPPPTITAPPPPVAAPAPAPVPVARAAPTPAPAARPARTATRTATRAPAPATVRRAAPAPAPVAEAPVAAPVTAPESTAPAAPPAAEIAPAPAPAEALPVETPTQTRSIMPWLVAGGLFVLAALAFLFLRRRRRDEEVYEETYYEEPVVADAVVAAPEPSFVRPAPIAAAPVVAAEERPNEVEVTDSAQADVDALAAESAPVAGRPWLEFLMRPVRAGTSQDDAIVQFELTVGNTGEVDARDVRISTWMVAAGPGTDMESMLIAPPADATVSEVDIDAGDGTRVEGEISLSKSGLGDESVLPVIVADARYRLPDGSEGRTHASFAIGMPDGDDIAPFPIDRASGLLENVEARLHGEPERV